MSQVTELAMPDNGGPNKGHSLFIFIWISASISTLIVALRVFIRFRLSRLMKDDFMMMASWLCNIVFSIFLSIAIHYGLGRHMDRLDHNHSVNAIHFDFVSQGFGVLSPMFGRISFAITMLNVFGITSRTQKHCLRASIVVQILQGVSTVILIYVQCHNNISALWDPKVRANADCWSPEVQIYYGYFQSSICSVTDLFLSLLPACILPNMQMERKRKLQLVPVLALSLSAMVASVVKTFELRNLGRRNDFTWNTPIFFACVIVETNIVQMTASIVMLKPLFNRDQLFGGLWSSIGSCFNRFWPKKSSGLPDTLTSTLRPTNEHFPANGASSQRNLLSPRSPFDAYGAAYLGVMTPDVDEYELEDVLPLPKAVCREDKGALGRTLDDVYV